VAVVEELPGGVRLNVLVQPRASRSKLVGEHDGRLKIALAAPPVDGEANAALIEFVAELLKVKRAQVELSAGQSSRRKTLTVRGISAAEVAKLVNLPVS